MRKLCWTSLTTLAILCFASPAQAKLVINLRFPDGSTTRVLTPADVGTAIQIQVWASVDNELAPAENLNGTGTHEGLQFVFYSLISNRSTPSSVSGRLQSAVMRSPFNGQGSGVGASVDLNADGIRDYGSFDAYSMNHEVFARAPGPVFDEPALWEEFGVQPPTINSLDVGSEFLVETLAMRIEDLGSGTNTSIDPYIPSWIFGAVPGSDWWQDSSLRREPQGNIFDGLNNLTYFAGTSVTFTATPVPEPASAALFAAGITAVGVWSARKGPGKRRES